MNHRDRNPHPSGWPPAPSHPLRRQEDRKIARAYKRDDILIRLSVAIIAVSLALLLALLIAVPVIQHASP